ncbi:MAG: flagellar biosynthetic protein FliO, partial [Sphingomonadales bacterium]|nr:flagellar biosynthetic protein FliO [Sphingomonadales bacterium]
MRRFAAFLPGVLAFAGPAQAQALAQGDGGSAVSAWRVVLALLFVLALGVAAIFAMRRRFGALPLASAPGKRIRVIEQQYLGPQRALYLVEIDGLAYAALF